ncbi:hypothetical protein [Achromobacter mucicolens]|uniref:hypothetical protein n=1 Tax=Achromobacter mucicolens TaxID=1389922 RepID=UPI0028AD64BB|nr:hypothetical protein [Achromobacter mucicolens]
MNAKTIKNIRQQLRSAGVAVGHAEYKAEASHYVPVNTGKTTATGLPMIVQAEVCGTIRLLPSCGRSIYKRAKASAIA